ncbi:MAG: glycosyltransferase family 4 protein [Rhizobacter sp.]
MPLDARLRWKLRRLLRWLKVPLVRQPDGNPHTDGILCLQAQGPTMEGLMRYLRDHGPTYQALIFMTALYHPAAMGVLVHPQRSILIPTLHDEKMMYLPHFHRVFRAPRWILFNTTAEAQVAEALYGKNLAPSKVCGVGIDMPLSDNSVDSATFVANENTKKFGINQPYLLYLGRIDTSKGCGVLFKQFSRFAKKNRQPLLLVVAGKAFMKLPQIPSIIYTGFVSDEERNSLIANALALVVPSRYESLSLVALEAMSFGKPVIVTRHSEVLAQHIHDSGAGYAYGDFSEFSDAVNSVLSMPESDRQLQAQRARHYVSDRYSWPRVTSILLETIDSVSAATSSNPSNP